MMDIRNEKLSKTPHEPGVYLMKDDQGKILYVGKARDLKKRLSSYFVRQEQAELKTSVLIKKVVDFEVIITASEKEALILEANLIKRHRPRYNVSLKDDKRYPLLRLDLTAEYPYLTIVRKMKRDGAQYFGPYVSASAVRQTLKFINKNFKLRKCTIVDVKRRERPCLNYQIGVCLGLCCHEVDKKAYGQIVKEVILFLKGRTPALIHKVKRRMEAAAEGQDYETAAQMRDKMFALERTLERQLAVTRDQVDRDVLGLARTSDKVLITILFIRGGFLWGKRNYLLDEYQVQRTDEAIFSDFIRQYYMNTHFIPREIILPVVLSDGELVEEWAGSLKGGRVFLITPQKGGKLGLIKMAFENAVNELEHQVITLKRHMDLLAQLKRKLRLKNVPLHIECFDNSNISGAEPVSGMVVFKNGQPDKSAYRKYNLQHLPEPDDYAYMAEALGRRFGKREAAAFPDLLIVDGGKGQLNIAVAILRSLEIEGLFDVIGIAKKDPEKGELEDKIYTPGRVNPLNCSGEQLRFVERVRDEAHRFAILTHRKRHRKTAVKSALDDIPGIGIKRKTVLLNHLGSVKKIRAASVEELRALPGMNLKTAELVLKYLKEG